MFIQHELHSMKRSNVDASTYKRFQKTVAEDINFLRKTVSADLKLIKDTATKDYEIIKESASAILHIPTADELAKTHRISGHQGAGGKKDDTPPADDDGKFDDDVREDDDDVIQEPGEEPQYFPGRVARDAIKQLSASLAGALGGLSHATAALLHPDLILPTPQIPPPEAAALAPTATAATAATGAASGSGVATNGVTRLVAAGVEVEVQGELTSTKLTAAISAKLKVRPPYLAPCLMPI